MTRCWYYDVSDLAEPHRYRVGLAQLPWASRRQQAERFLFEKDRLLCLGAGLLCAHALRCEGVSDLTLAQGAYGKPYLAHAPNVHFNLSHSGHMVACVVGASSVGVDVEERHAVDDDVLRMCFQDKEIRWMRAQEDGGQAFTRMWTRKESYLKLLGTGLSEEAKTYAVLPEDETVLRVAFHEVVVDNHFLCVCVGVGEPVEFVRWKRDILSS